MFSNSTQSKKEKSGTSAKSEGTWGKRSNLGMSWQTKMDG